MRGYKYIIIIAVVIIAISLLYFQPWKQILFLNYSINFSAEGKRSDDSKIIVLSNKGLIAIKYLILIPNSEHWLTINKTSGSLKRRSSEEISVVASCKELCAQEEDYLSKIRIEFPDSKLTAYQIDVNLHCYPSPPRPRISFSPQSIEFSAQAGRDANRKWVKVANDGDSVLIYKLFPSEDWIKLAKNEGKVKMLSSQDIPLNATCENKKVGFYEGNIKIESENAINPSEIVPISLNCMLPPKPTPPNPRHVVALTDRLKYDCDLNPNLKDIYTQLLDYERQLEGILNNLYSADSLAEQRLNGQKKVVIRDLNNLMRKRENEMKRIDKIIRYYDNRKDSVSSYKDEYQKYLTEVEEYNSVLESDDNKIYPEPMINLNEVDVQVACINILQAEIEKSQCSVESVKYLIANIDNRCFFESTCDPEKLLDQYLDNFINSIKEKAITLNGIKTKKYPCVGITDINKIDEGGNNKPPTPFCNIVRDKLASRITKNQLWCKDPRNWIFGEYRIINKFTLELSLRIKTEDIENDQITEPVFFKGKYADPNWDDELDVTKCQ